MASSHDNISVQRVLPSQRNFGWLGTGFGTVVRLSTGFGVVVRLGAGFGMVVWLGTGFGTVCVGRSDNS